MCKSAAEGGQRCSAHTRARFDKATDNLAVAAATGDPERIQQARAAWETAAVEHASTREGRNELRKKVSEHTAAGDDDLAANTTNIIQRGTALQAANREVAEAIRAANRPEARTARDIANGRYSFADDDTAVMSSARFVCENHDQPGSCDVECVQLLDAMAGDDGTSVTYDPTGTSYGPDKPYTVHSYDVSRKAAVEYVITPIDRLDDTSRETVLAALDNR